MQTAVSAPAVELDLTSFACGTRQHVFLATGVPDHGWVYKLPSALGAAEHYGTDLGGYRPTGPLGRALYRTFVEFPNDQHRRRLARLEAQGAREQRIRDAERRHRRLCEARGRSVAVVYRWTRRRHFRGMIALAQSLARYELTAIALPFEVLAAVSALLHIGDRVERYRGPALAQLRADFFDRSGRFDEFRWDDVIEAQHALWRHGIGLSDANEILGPKNWALIDHRLRLADLSSLTRNARTARRLLGGDILDERQGRVLERLRRQESTESVDLARRYFEHVRRSINQKAFDQIWRSRASGGATG